MRRTVFAQANLVESFLGPKFNDECLDLLLNQNLRLDTKKDLLEDMKGSECRNIPEWLKTNHLKLRLIFVGTELQELYSQVEKEFLKES